MSGVLKSRVMRRSVAVVGIALGGVAAVDSSESGTNGAVKRAAYAFVTAARLGMMYKFASRRGWDDTTGDAQRIYSSNMSNAHETGAGLVRRTCEQNGGVYVKLGQMLAQLDHLLPLAYVEALRPLLDACPQQPWRTVEKVLKSESPLLLEHSDIDRAPVATASLAQVHRARLKNSDDEIAVKVQHDGLARHSHWDVRVIQSLLLIGAKQFELLRNMEWLGDELESSLKDELNFSLEAENCAKCAQNLSQSSTTRDSVLTPKILSEYSSGSVLVMSWEHGVPVDDVAGIRALGLKPRDVSHLLASALAEQIFVHGHVHCDPHAANVLVRQHPNHPHSPQLVVLDHGLYRTLAPELRLGYARLWMAIACGDRDTIYNCAKELGVDGEQNAKMLAMMLTLRPWDIIELDRGEHSVDHAALELVRGSDEMSDEVRKRIHDFIVENHDSMGKVLSSVPRELLLIFKTSDCVRAIERRLGAHWGWLQATARISSQVVADHERLIARERAANTSSSHPWSPARLSSNAGLVLTWTRVSLNRAILELQLALLSLLGTSPAQSSQNASPSLTTTSAPSPSETE